MKRIRAGNPQFRPRLRFDDDDQDEQADRPTDTNRPSFRSSDSRTGDKSQKPDDGDSKDEEEDDYMTMVVETPVGVESSLQKRARERKAAQAKAHPKSASQLAAESLSQVKSALERPTSSLAPTNKGFQLLSKLGFTAGSALGRPGRTDVSTRPIAVRLPGSQLVLSTPNPELDEEENPSERRKRQRVGIGYDSEQLDRVRTAGLDALKQAGLEGPQDDEYSSDEQDDTPVQDLDSTQKLAAARRSRPSIRSSFRNRLQTAHEEQRIERVFVAAQRIAFDLTFPSSDSKDDDPDEDPKVESDQLPSPEDVNVMWRQYIINRLEFEQQKAAEKEMRDRIYNRPTLSLSERTVVDVSDSDEDDNHVEDRIDSTVAQIQPQDQPYFSSVDLATAPPGPGLDPSTGADAKLDDDADEELAVFNALPAVERLEKLVNYLRTELAYCFWCKCRYGSVDEMDGPDGCPGPDEDSHG